MYVLAKHGQDPRVGLAGLMQDSTLPDLLKSVGAPVAQATQDDVSLIWLQNQATTPKAVAALQQFQQTGTISVYFQGVPQTLPASQVIDKILWGPSLVAAGLGNPATDSTTPDIIVTLKPGYIWVGSVTNQHKRAEHGGFSEDDTHVALVVSGGALPSAVQGTTVGTTVQTQQIAVSVLQALGLDPTKLTGAVIDNTQPLPGLTSASTGGNNAVSPLVASSPFARAVSVTSDIDVIAATDRVKVETARPRTRSATPSQLRSSAAPIHHGPSRIRLISSSRRARNSREITTTSIL